MKQVGSHGVRATHGIPDIESLIRELLRFTVPALENSEGGVPGECIPVVERLTELIGAPVHGPELLRQVGHVGVLQQRDQMEDPAFHLSRSVTSARRGLGQLSGHGRTFRGRLSKK